MAYNHSQKLNNNIAAIRLTLQWEEGKTLKIEDVEILQKFSGFGGLKAVLYPAGQKDQWLKLNATQHDIQLYPKVMELHTLLQHHYQEKQYAEIIHSMRNSVLTAFYTPDIIPKTLYAILKEKDIAPNSLYEPSSGSGIFISEAVKYFDKLQQITAVEKDLLSGRVLEVLSASLNVPAKVHIKGFEEAPVTDNNQYDLIVSNIPFGNFSVYDPAFRSEALSGKIHNYFFAKGLDKIKEGGLLAYITTDAFLNSPSNEETRKYLFEKANFIAAAVMPDNLMKDTGNTEAPSHLLIVQKNSGKQQLSDDEQLLIKTIGQENEFGHFHSNSYLYRHPETVTGNEIKAGKNQYGKAHQRVWQHGDINEIGTKIKEILKEGIVQRFDAALWEKRQLSSQLSRSESKKLTFLPVPQNKAEKVTVQLGLFDAPFLRIQTGQVPISVLQMKQLLKSSQHA